MKYERELEMLRLSKSALQRSTEQLESELKVSRMEATSLKEVVARMTADASAIQCQLDATKVKMFILHKHQHNRVVCSWPYLLISTQKIEEV